MATPKSINRSSYGEYGLSLLDGYEVPYLSAKKAEELVPTSGGFISNFSHGRGAYTAGLGWSSNSYAGKLARGASAFGVQATPIMFQGEGRTDISGNPTEPLGYQYENLDAVADRFGVKRSDFKPYEKDVEGYTVDPETGRYSEGVYENLRDSEGSSAGQRRLTRTVSVEEQMYNKLNDLTKDYFSYTADTLVPGLASEGGEKSFQTVLYKKEGDLLKPLSKPVEHGGMQNPDVYTGGSGFKLSELIRGVAPIAAFAIGAPFLDAALGAGATAAQAASGAASAAGTAGAQTGNAMLASLGLGAEAALPYTAAAGLPSSLFTVGSAAPGFVGLTPEFATELGLSGGSGLSSAGASGNVLAGLPGISEGFVGLTPEYAAELGLEGGSGLTTEGMAGEPLANLYGLEGMPGSYPGDSQYIEQDIMEQARATNVPSGSPTSWDTGVPSLLTPAQALLGARLASGLLGRAQQQPQLRQPQLQMPQIRPAGAVDYSGLLGLITPRMTRRNPNSLLG